jgi:hypothetical protein
MRTRRSSDGGGRWRRGAGAVLAAMALASAGRAPGEDPEADAGGGRVDEAVARALAFLRSQQKPDGSIGDSGNVTAMTALSILAFAAVGHGAGDPTPEGESVRRALEFVLKDDRQDGEGYFGARDGSRMYGHGITSLMLAEMLGMGADGQQDARLRDRLSRALSLILGSQDQKRKGDGDAGGWRYEPKSRDADLSVTIWQLMALRAAKNAEMDVPAAAIDLSVGYVKRCFGGSARRGAEAGAFCYQPGHSPSYASAAAGLLAMQVCGQYDAREVESAADWLKNRRLRYDDNFFFYGTYYYAQGMYQRGGEWAEHARREVERLLLEHQDKDGGWTPAAGQERSAGRVYGTAMAVLSLSVKYHFLPIYQR